MRNEECVYNGEFGGCAFRNRSGIFNIFPRMMKFGKMKFKAAKSETGCRFDASYKGKHVSFESDDMSLYDDALSENERRSKAARRVIYENIKHKYYEDSRS